MRSRAIIPVRLGGFRIRAICRLHDGRICNGQDIATHSNILPIPLVEVVDHVIAVQIRELGREPQVAQSCLPGTGKLSEGMEPKSIDQKARVHADQPAEGERGHGRSGGERGESGNIAQVDATPSADEEEELHVLDGVHVMFAAVEEETMGSHACSHSGQDSPHLDAFI